MQTKRNAWFLWFGALSLSSLLMYLSWPNHKLPFLSFVGLAILFISIRSAPGNSINKTLVLFASISVFRLIWVGGNSMWLADSTPKSFLYFTLIDATVFALVLLPSALALSKKRKYAWLFFISSWMSLEYLSQHFELSQPFFCLGFVFGEFPSFIQFYKYLGIEGGSLLILIVSICLALLVEDKLNGVANKRSSFIGFGVSILPFVFSPFLVSHNEAQEKIKVLSIHSYRKTYDTRYHQNPELMVDQLWTQSVAALQRHPDAQLLVWPETLISNLDWLSNPTESRAYKRILEKLQNYPELTLVTGGYGFSIDPMGQKNPYASFDKTNKRYFTGHNVAISIKPGGQCYIRSKEKFIPFQEQVPYLGSLPFLSNLVDVVGSNTTTSYYSKGIDIHPLRSGAGFTPILCYESVFPLFMAKKVQNNALIVLLANEYWIPNLSGSERYLAANSPIAIQSGISIVRSANSGISASVDPNGIILHRKSGKQSGYLFDEIPIKEESTVYEHIAGFIYYPSLILSAILLLFYSRSLVAKKKE